jgi:hypothetical protein
MHCIKLDLPHMDSPGYVLLKIMNLSLPLLLLSFFACSQQVLSVSLRIHCHISNQENQEKFDDLLGYFKQSLDGVIDCSSLGDKDAYVNCITALNTGYWEPLLNGLSPSDDFKNDYEAKKTISGVISSACESYHGTFSVIEPTDKSSKVSVDLEIKSRKTHEPLMTKSTKTWISVVLIVFIFPIIGILILMYQHSKRSEETQIDLNGQWGLFDSPNPKAVDTSTDSPPAYEKV